MLYTYKATVTDVHDGDSITCMIDLGFGVNLHKAKIRLARINAQEINTTDNKLALQARSWLRDRLLDKAITLETHKDRKGKYGRYIGEVWLGGVNLNDELVRQGLAQYQEY